MRVVAESPSTVAFTVRPTGVRKWLGLAALALGLGAGALWRGAALRCERGGDCVVRAWGVLHAGAQRFPAASLARVRVATARGPRGGTRHRAELATAQGPVPLPLAPGATEGEVRARLAPVEAFVAGRGPDALVLEAWDAGTAALALGGVLAGLVLGLLGARSYRGEVRRSEEVLVLERRGLLGTRRTEHPLRTLRPFARASRGKAGGRPVVALTLATTSGAWVLRLHTFDDAETREALARVNRLLVRG
jgi:hypothetical protein